LQALLNITADFATKWNLKFNSDKSKVLVIGKRIDYNKELSLGSDVLKDTNAYKYLSYNCVILSTNKGGQINFLCYLVMDLIKYFWYMIHVER